MKMKFMAANSRDGENVELAVHTLVQDTLAHQRAHRNDPVDPWATPSSTDNSPVSHVLQHFGVLVGQNAPSTSELLWPVSILCVYFIHDCMYCM